jgi:hypothetical protein
MVKPEEYFELLLYYQLGLEHDLIDKEKVIKWADSIIEKEPLSDYFFIELSLSKSKTGREIAHFIDEKMDFKESIIANRAFLGFLSEFVIEDELSISEALGIVYKLFSGEEFTSFEKEMLGNFEFDLNALEFGETHITEAQIQFRFERFLSVYSIFKEDNFEKWRDLNEEIPQKLMEFKEQCLVSNKTPKPWWKRFFN